MPAGVRGTQPGVDTGGASGSPVAAATVRDRGVGDLAGVRHDAADDRRRRQPPQRGTADRGPAGCGCLAGRRRRVWALHHLYPIPDADADRVAATPGIVRADPLVMLHSTLHRPSVRDVNVIGTRRGLGAPPLAEGHDQSQEGGLSLRSLSGMMACSSDDQHKAERERITCWDAIRLGGPSSGPVDPSDRRRWWLPGRFPSVTGCMAVQEPIPRR
jgi:hypothetical protein